MIESLFVSVAVVAVVEFTKLLRERNYWSAANIALAAGIGALAGFFQVEGLTIVTGIMAGLVAAGAFKLVK